MHGARVSRTTRTVYVSGGVNARAAAALTACMRFADSQKDEARTRRVTRTRDASGCNVGDRSIDGLERYQ